MTVRDYMAICGFVHPRRHITLKYSLFLQAISDTPAICWPDYLNFTKQKLVGNVKKIPTVMEIPTNKAPIKSLFMLICEAFC